jgi:hypothetical protein
MLSVSEVRERAEYCYLVFLQLSCLRANHSAVPARYLDYLKRSTLRLADDEFVLTILDEEMKMGTPDGGLGYLIALYEGFSHAYCEVLQIPLEEIRDGIPLAFREKLSAEMDGKQPTKRKKREKPGS